MNKRFVPLVFVFLSFGPAFVHAASFDCAKAKTHVEILVCGDKALSELDEQLDKAYRERLSTAENPDALRTEQRAWLRGVRDRCNNVVSLQEVYTKRLEDLNKEFYGWLSLKMEGQPDEAILRIFGEQHGSLIIKAKENVDNSMVFDGVYRLGVDKFLLFLTESAYRLNGAYLLNEEEFLNGKKMEKMFSESQVIQVLKDKSLTPYLLALGYYMQEGKSSGTYSLLRIDQHINETSRKELVESYKDGEVGGCGTRIEERAVFNIQYVREDLNRDGFDDLKFSWSEQNCKTLKKIQRCREILFVDHGFEYREGK